MFYKKFLKQSEFESESDYRDHYKLVIPDGFNFSYDVIDAAAETDPDKVALIWLNDSGDRRVFTFADLRDESNRAANAITAAGLKKGDIVLFFLRRRFEYWILMLAAHKTGIIPVPSTNLLKSHDIAYRLTVSNARAVIAFDDGIICGQIERAVKDSKTTPGLFTVGGARKGWTDLSAPISAASNKFARVPNKNDDIIFIYFTSGTTAMPKMVAHTYTYPLGHINTGVFWFRLTPDDIHFALSDTGWVMCAYGKMYGPWMAGAATLVYDFVGKFEPSKLLSVLVENRVTGLIAAPTVYKLLLAEDIKKYNWNTLKKADVGGEPLNPEVYRKFLGVTGVKLHEGYGQSEMTGMIFVNEWMDIKPGSMGRPAADWDVHLLDEDCKIVPDGSVGEICVNLEHGRPAGLMREYYKDPELNASAFRGGHYHTGDMAYRDADGYFWFVGRNDDLIKSSGYRISPFEVESVLMEHPSVRECAVTGVSDARRGMVVKASIILHEYFQATDVLVSELQNFVKSKTAPYKYPRIIEFVAELPMTVTGKIKRVEIRNKDKIVEG